MKCFAFHAERIKKNPRGFTLTEVIMAVTILSLIWLGMQSAMLIAARATPGRNGINNSTLRAGMAMDQINADLSYAISLNSSTANLIDFNVPDRNGDGLAETIRYSWSGVAGDPLLRSINGGTATAVLSSASNFQITLDKRATKLPASFTESAEQLLLSTDGGFGVSDYYIDNNSAVGEMIIPSLPANISYWRITRVKVRARTAGAANGEMSVQVRGVAAGSLPQNGIIDYTKLLESNLFGFYSWVTISFTNATNLSPGSGAYITFLWGSDAQAGAIQYRYDASFANALCAYSNDDGNSWHVDPANFAILMYVYGTYATQNADAYQYNLTDVRCTLKSGTDANSQLSTTIRVANEPLVSGP